MDNQDEVNETNVHAEEQSIAIGSIDVGGDLSGKISIGHTIGYTAEQVSVLLAQIKTDFQPKPFEGRSPYKGLDYFEETDAPLFFGREKLVEYLVGRVKETQTVFITGPSGSGKSSLVRAGVLHSLKSGNIKETHSEAWLYATFKPGREPIEALALAFSRLKTPDLAKYFRENLDRPDIVHQCAESALSDSPSQRLVLFVDQFEEVFTQLSAEKAEAFIRLITNAANSKDGRIILLFAMRSDFISNCANFPELNALLNRQFVQIGAMQPEELVSAIAQPALRVGLRIDPDLIAQIINDMQGEPGALPLMQFALQDLFEAEQAKGGVIALTREAYLLRGGIQKSLERHADASFEKLNRHEQELAHTIFSGLIEIGRGTADTRRTAMFEELVPANAKEDEIQSIVRKLADARLITTDEAAGRDIVTISHEKLIEAWPWLKKLVNENRGVIALQNEIFTDAKEWDDHNRDKSYLYTGARLANAREQLRAKKLSLSGTAYQFILISQKRHQRNQLTTVAGISTIIVLLVLAATLFRQQADINAETAMTAQAANTLAVQQASIAQAANTLAVEQQHAAEASAWEAQRQANIARAGQLSALSVALREKNFSVSLLLSVEAFRELPSVQTRGSVLDSAQANPALVQYLARPQEEVFAVTVSPDGKMLASGSKDDNVILWDLENYQPIGDPLRGHSGSVASVDFSPDGSILASGSVDKTIILWDIQTHQPIGSPFAGHEGTVTSIAFHPSGEILGSGSIDNKVMLWDVESQEPIGSLLDGHNEAITDIAFSPDGTLLASGSADNTIILWDVESQKPIGPTLKAHNDAITSIAFSPDGKFLASGSADKTIILWNLDSHQPIDLPFVGHSDAITSIAMSPDGKTLISGSVDRTIMRWNIKSHSPIGQPLVGHSSWVRSVSISPDGRLIASAGRDSMVILWDVNNKSRLGRSLNAHENVVYSVAISENGELIASGSADENIILWDVKSGQPIVPPLTGSTGAVNSVAFSPDGMILASGSMDPKVILWDVESHQLIKRLDRHKAAVYSVSFSPDGRLLASGSLDKSIIIWDVENGQPIGEPLTGHEGAINSVSFSPDGQLLASGSIDKTIILWDVESRKQIGEPLRGHDGAVYSIAFSADGKALASGSSDFSVILWSVENRQPIKSPLLSQNGFIYSVAFSPDGKTLASGAYQNSIQLWNVENIENPLQFGGPFVDNTLTISGLAFSQDGRILVSGSVDNSVILWDLGSESWIENICQRVGRNFTSDEWIQYFPSGEDYRVTCQQWPGAEGISSK